MGMGFRSVRFYLSAEGHAAMHRSAGVGLGAVVCTDALFLRRWWLKYDPAESGHTDRNLHTYGNRNVGEYHANPKPDTRGTVDVNVIRKTNDVPGKLAAFDRSMQHHSM